MQTWKRVTVAVVLVALVGCFAAFRGPTTTIQLISLSRYSTKGLDASVSFRSADDFLAKPKASSADIVVLDKRVLDSLPSPAFTQILRRGATVAVVGESKDLKALATEMGWSAEALQDPEADVIQTIIIRMVDGKRRNGFLATSEDYVADRTLLRDLVYHWSDQP